MMVSSSKPFAITSVVQVLEESAVLPLRTLVVVKDGSWGRCASEAAMILPEAGRAHPWAA